MLLTGLTIMTAGLAWLIRVPVDGTCVVDLLPSMILLGVGPGLSFPSLNTLAMADVAPSDSGLASGLVNTTGQLVPTLRAGFSPADARAVVIRLARRELPMTGTPISFRTR